MSNHTLLTIWESLLRMNLQELTQWFTLTDVSVKNYFDCKLTTKDHINVSETEIAALLPRLGKIRCEDLPKRKTGNLTLYCPEIINVSIFLFPACTKYFMPQEDCHCP